MEKPTTAVCILLTLASCVMFEPDKPLHAAEKEYLAELEKCDAIYGEFNDGDTFKSNADYQNALYGLADCYKNVAHKVIDKHYSKHAKEMKKHFAEYMKATYGLSADFYMKHDVCPGSCGTQVYVYYKSAAAAIVKNIVQNLIDANAMNSIEY